MTNSEKYDEDYFMRGVESGKSLYTSYSWKPELTIPMAQRIVNHCNISESAKVLDFGCARGYLVRALRYLGYAAYGYDVSDWAIKNADPLAAPYLSLSASETFKTAEYDWIIAKDVLEHIEYVRSNINRLMEVARVGIFAVVPLSEFPGSIYVIEEYEKDVTHCQRWPLWKWGEMFARPGWSVEVSYRIPGIKDNYAQYPTGNGFLTCRRMEEIK